MEKLLNRGLKFAVLPLKLDITQVLVDYKRYERSAIWQEFWYGREGGDRKPQIFRKRKHNLPKNHKIPEGLKTFLGAVKSEIMDHRNRNRAECNLPPEEVNALKELIRLQTNRVVVIKPCDKGAGIMILDFKEYMRVCYEHLESKLTYENGDSTNYYTKVHISALERAKTKVKEVVDEAYENNIITKEEHEAMNVEDGDPAKFYTIFKVHKKHPPNTAPPPRPIISGSGSVFENIGKFIEHHIKDFANKHDSFLQDTPHFLRTLEEVNKNIRLKENSILVTIDVKALFTNILHDEGLQTLQGVLDGNKQEVPQDLILKLMEILLKHNIFTFDEQHFRQEVGAAMGSPPVPSYANIFMAGKIDTKIMEASKNSIQLMKRFLDDLFIIFNGSTKELHTFFTEINQIHPTIKFTMNHTSLSYESESDRCSCEPQSFIPFLDTKCWIENCRIETDLFRKETDRNQYLLTDSCHSMTCIKNVPFSLALRIVRICSKPEHRENRFSELKNLLTVRGYSVRLIDSAIQRARSIPRKVSLYKSKNTKESNKRPVFAVSYDPRLPSITSLQAKHWRTMVGQDSYLAEVFPDPPLTAFKRQKNLKDYLVRAKVPKLPSIYPKRHIKGMKKCGTQLCTACPYVREGKSIKIGEKTWNINNKLDCNSYNVVYILICKKEKCKEKYYIGETKNMIRFRLSQHRGYIVNKKLNTATGEHFNLPGHSVSDLSMTILEQVKKNDTSYRREREKYHINKFNTFHKGINKKA